jgi:hypothetical protein
VSSESWRDDVVLSAAAAGVLVGPDGEALDARGQFVVNAALTRIAVHHSITQPLMHGYGSRLAADSANS